MYSAPTGAAFSGFHSHRRHEIAGAYAYHTRKARPTLKPKI